MSKLIKCKTCGNEIAREAEVCPHCGAKKKKFISCGGCLAAPIIIVLVLFIIGYNLRKVNGGSEALNLDEEKIIVETSLDYLKTVPEVSGFTVLGKNEVYIKLKKAELFSDYNAVCNAAAFNASKALVDNKKIFNICTVYLIPPDSTPGEKNKIIYTAYASDGKVQSSRDGEYGETIKLQSMTKEQRKAFMLDKKAKMNANVFERNFVSSFDGSVKPVVQYVKSNMNDPDSFKHVKTNWWYINGTTDRYRVKMTFRGKNAFGAVVVNSVDLEVDLNGNVLKK